MFRIICQAIHRNDCRRVLFASAEVYGREFNSVMLRHRSDYAARPPREYNRGEGFHGTASLLQHLPHMPLTRSHFQTQCHANQIVTASNTRLIASKNRSQAEAYVCKLPDALFTSAPRQWEGAGSLKPQSASRLTSSSSNQVWRTSPLTGLWLSQ
jgi:hypothetical protein